MGYTIKNILVAVDLSEASLNALNTAISIAKTHDAAVHVVNIIEQDYAGEAPGDLNSTEVLNALMESIYHSHEIVPTLARHKGNVSEVIIRISALKEFDLVVVGTHGASGYRNGFVGSNTYNVLKYTRCPVITVPPGHHSVIFEKVVFPIRPVTGALSKYHVLRQFVPDTAVIDVLGLPFVKTDKSINVLERIIEEVTHDPNDKANMCAVWTEGRNISDEVLDYTNRTLPDLVVVTDNLDATIKPSYIGPHAQKIINVSKSPILQIKNFEFTALQPVNALRNYSNKSLV